MKTKPAARFSLFLFTILIAASLSGCGAKGNNYSVSKDSVDSASAEISEEGFGGVSNYEEQDTKTENQDTLVNSEQKLVYEASMTIQTKAYDDTLKEINAYVSKGKGYIENVSYNAYGNSRDCCFIIRIPVASYRDFLTDVKSTGNVRSLNESVEDVTSNYIDVKARLKSLNSKMDKLEKLKEKADNLDQLLKIEDQITEVQYEIENYTSQLKYLNNRISYSTVTINVEEVVVYSESENESFLDRFLDANKESISQFVAFFQNFCIFIVYAYPYLIFIGLIIFFLLFLKKRIRKNKPAKQKKPKKKLFSRKIKENNEEISSEEESGRFADNESKNQ